MRNYLILVINPGSTSTKIAVYQNNTIVFAKNVKHSNSDLEKFDKITDQFDFRKSVILHELSEAHINIKDLSIIVGRGGIVKPISSGVYEVNDRLKEDLINSTFNHASNLGGLIADNIAKSIPGIKAYIADPVVVDELEDIARYAGHSLYERVSIFHALNQKAIAKTHAKSIGDDYINMNMIVAHLGGGISVGAHRKGKVIDVNQALDGEGPFSPERSGTLPTGQLVKLCYSGKYTQKEVNKMLKGKGGLVSYLGTNDAYEVEQRAKNGDITAQKVQDAMAYQISKEIGSMASVLHGQVDYIILTGGMAHNNYIIDFIKEMVSFIAPVAIYPGEDEMKALAINGMNILTGEAESKVYS